MKDEPVVAEEPSIQEELQEPEMPPVPEPSPTATPEPVVAQEADQLAQPAPAPTPIAKPPRRKSSRFRHASQLDAEGKGSRVQSHDGGEWSSVGSCGLLAEPSSRLSRRSEAKPTTRSSSLSRRRERCWAGGISDADQELRVSNSRQLGARRGAQMEVPSVNHRRCQSFLERESSRPI